MRNFALKSIGVAFLMTFLLTQPALSQGQTATPGMQEAAKLFQAQKWAEAATALEAVTRAEPDNSRAWYYLGMSLLSMNKSEQAVDALRRAEAIAHNPIVMYNLACAYVRAGNKDAAFEWLGKAIQTGTIQTQQLNADTDLTSLREDARFKELLDQAQRITKPCAFSQKSREFDFWVGEWDVQTPQGQPAGTNNVQLIFGDCVVFENWKGRGGFSGKSFNFYNSGTGKWQQVWVDDRGSVLQLFGEYKDGAMRYQGETPGPDGTKTLERLTFTKMAEGRVHQFWEQSRDGGKTWAVAFDGIYVRKKANTP